MIEFQFIKTILAWLNSEVQTFNNFDTINVFISQLIIMNANLKQSLAHILKKYTSTFPFALSSKENHWFNQKKITNDKKERKNAKASKSRIDSLYTLLMTNPKWDFLKLLVSVAFQDQSDSSNTMVEEVRMEARTL